MNNIVCLKNFAFRRLPFYFKNNQIGISIEDTSSKNMSLRDTLKK